MTRIASSNYTASGTNFQWATAGTDRFFRTLDLYYLALAVEGHDHSSGKGLAVTRLANDSVGSDELEDGAVTTDKIGSLQVTTAKIADANVTTAKILDANVTTAKINDLAVTAGKLAADAVTTTKILDANVTTAKINDLAVTAGKLAADAVTTTKILDANVTTAKINDLAVTEGKLAAGAVTADKIGTGAVTADKIGTGAVTVTKIPDDSITPAKLDANDSPSDNEVPTYDQATGKFEWQAVSALVSASAGSRVGDGKLFFGQASALTAEAAAGWLNCDGSAVSRTTYADLFAKLGTTWGAGNGSTTFNLPDLRNFFPMGAGSTYAVGSTGGAASVDLSHDHGFTPSVSNANYTNTANTASGGGTHQTIGTHGHTGVAGVTDQGSSGEPLTTVNILNPYKGVYILIYSGVTS